MLRIVTTRLEKISSQRDHIEQSASPIEVHCHSFVVPLVVKCGDEEVLLATFNANGSHELRIPLWLSGVGMSTIVDMSPFVDTGLFPAPGLRIDKDARWHVNNC